MKKKKAEEPGSVEAVLFVSGELRRGGSYFLYHVRGKNKKKRFQMYDERKQEHCCGFSQKKNETLWNDTFIISLTSNSADRYRCN